MYVIKPTKAQNLLVWYFSSKLFSKNQNTEYVEDVKYIYTVIKIFHSVFKFVNSIKFISKIGFFIRFMRKVMNKSLVEYFGSDQTGHSCGYCKKLNGSLSHGMWAHYLQCQGYMELIDRGWRRCDATNIKLTKSQKKVVKRFHKFLTNGLKNEKQSLVNNMENFDDELHEVHKVEKLNFDFCENSNAFQSTIKNCPMLETVSSQMTFYVTSENTNKDRPLLETVSSQMTSQASQIKPVKDCLTNLKAKNIRKERKITKLKKKAEENGLLFDESSFQKKQKCPEKSIEDLLEGLPNNGVHKLELKLVQCCPQSEEYQRTFHKEHLLFIKYQMLIHKESIEDCSEAKFLRFLVKGPLEPESIYGAYHQQYYLDGNLIAVGVLDILPLAVSSVYFFYDPDYSFLSLGTYSAIREIYLVRELQKQHHDLKYYYMGFYIHSCSKMRYKKQYYPSFLLCPETYSWISIEKALPKLDISKYSRLSDGIIKEQQLATDHVMVLHRNKVVQFNTYLQRITDRHEKEKQIKEVEEYLTLTGLSALNMILYRS
ncbi:arginyl-tRNA--protein transferase 1 isoform X2 [Hydra vulgaris]|uniref:arginyl-tRNA--protein transferase 1 isoform X2 n=1 Tax=Hydra vulgaris TaxID=6087 RepID=UPI001F5E459C|nr:arginyl-tRNA--protein transferase 1 isoform X2 [Hydra vulgaris]